jgi:hypothetical protein
MKCHVINIWTSDRLYFCGPYLAYACARRMIGKYPYFQTNYDGHILNPFHFIIYVYRHVSFEVDTTLLNMYKLTNPPPLSVCKHLGPKSINSN